MKTCATSGCVTNARRRGLCTRHWRLAFPDEYKLHLADVRVRSNTDKHRRYVTEYTKKRRDLPHVRAARAASVTRYHDKPIARWMAHNRTARKRGIATELTREQFDHLTNQPCAYCGEPSPGKSFVGIDRLDSKRGYTDENCVPCCMVCNQMKMGRTMGDFIAKARQIVARSSSVVAAVGVLIVLAIAACSSRGFPPDGVPSDAAPSASRPLILDLGQSNAVGHGDVADVDPTWAQPFDSVTLTAHLILGSSQTLYEYSGELAPRHGVSFGAELSLGRALPDHDIAVCAQGSTSLAVDWAPDSELRRTCFALADSARVTAVVWQQGEHDAAYAAMAAAYGYNLKQLEADVVEQFPNARLFYYRIPRAETFADEVRAGEEAAQSDRAIMIDVDALPRIGVHFTSDGYLQLGELFAEAMSP